MKKLNIKDYKMYSYFIYSLIITMLLLFLFAGIVISEINIKRVAFGIYDPFFVVVKVPKQSFSLYMRIFGGNIEINFSCIYKIISYISSLFSKILIAIKSVCILYKK